MKIEAKLRSAWRIVVLLGAGAMLASGMSAAHAASTSPRPKPSAAKKPSQNAQLVRPGTSGGGGGSGRMSLEWTIVAPLRP